MLMRVILNFLMAVDRLSGLMIRPVLLFILVELFFILLNVKGFDITYADHQ